MADADYSVKAVITAQTSQFEQGMNKATNAVKSTNKVVDGLNSKLKTVFSSIGAIFAVSQLKKFSSESTKLWKNQKKQLDLLDSTLQTTGAMAWTSSKELTDFASSLQDVTNYGDEAITSMQNVLLGFKNIKGDTFKDATKAILDMSTVMKMDLASAAQTVGKALDDPIKGLGSLSRQGFIFNEEQKKLIKTLIETGKTAEAQKIILDELNTTYGGAAEATADVGEQLKNVWGDVKEKIGVALSGITDRFAVFMKDFLKNLNFDTFYNVFGNAYEMISTRINQIMGKFKELAKAMKEFAKSEDFKPFLRLFDTIAGAKKKEISNINNFIEGFAEGLRKLFANVDSKKLEKVINVIVTIIDVIYDIRDEIASVMVETQNLLFTIFGNIWTRIKEVFNNTNSELANSEGNIHSWGEFIYEELNDVYKVFQDLMGHIKAILTGDWKLAWEYAKLATLRVIDSIITGIDTMLLAFPKMTKVYTESINWMIKGVNKVREWFGDDPFDLIDPYKGKDDPLGVKELIKETEDEIAKTTGDSADHDILNLKGLSSTAQGTIENIVAKFTKANSILISQRKERKDYFVQADEEEGDSIKEVVQVTSEWNNKLLSQILDGLNEYDKEYLDVKKQIINAEKEEAIAKAETEADKQKIALYYLGEIEKAEEDYHKAVAEKYADDLKIVEDNKKKILQENKELRDKSISIFKEIGSKTGEVFKGVANIVSKTISGIVNIFKSAWNSFTNILKVNLSDSLDSILAFEDSILTFFFETLPKLPSYLNSVFQSVVVLVQTLVSNINFDSMKEGLDNLLKTITSELPSLVENVAGAFANIIDVLISTITSNAPAIMESFKNIILSLAATLEDIVPKILKFMQEMFVNIAEELPKIIETIVPVLVSIASQILDTITSIISEVIPKILPPLMKTLNENLPKLIESVVNFVVEVASQIPQILIDVLPTLINGVVKLITELVKRLPDLISAIIDILPELIQTIIYAVLENLPLIVTAVMEAIPKILISIVSGVFDLLHDLVFETDWGKIWSGIVNSLKAVWEGIGTFFSTIFDNLKKNVFEPFGKWFENMWNGLKTWFSNLWNGFVDVMKTPLNVMIKAINAVINGMNKISFSIPDWVPLIGGKKFGIQIPNLQELAVGTENARKGLTLVGEAGPELVNFRGGEQVLNNHNTNKALENMGGNTNNFNVTFNNLQDTTAFAMIQQLKQYNRQMAINGII